MEIKWITLNVTNLEKSKDFYSNYLGMKLESEFSPTEMLEIAFFSDNKGMQLELILDKTPEKKATSNSGVSLGISSDNYQNLLVNARETDILTVVPSVMGGKIECFFVKDPNGFSIQIIKP